MVLTFKLQHDQRSLQGVLIISFLLRYAEAWRKVSWSHFKDMTYEYR
jgi:hypothetical protein